MVVNRLARFLTEAFAPAVLIGLCLLVVGWQCLGPWEGLLIAGVGAGIPALALEIAHRRGTTDRHVRERTQRGPYILLACASILLALVITVVLGAPAPLLTVLVLIFLGAFVVGVITRWWKISGHATIAAFTLIPLGWGLRPWGLALLGLVIAVGWSRVHLRAHTVAQVVAGTLLGGVIAIAYLAAGGGGAGT